MRFLLLSIVVVLATPAYPAELVVSNTNDGGPDSLRAQIAAAADGDTIVFAPGLLAGNINLKSGSITISKNLTIDASALQIGVTVTGGAEDLMNPPAGQFRVFTILNGFAVTMNNLTITGGTTGDGDDGTTGSSPQEGGGGIFVGGDLTLINCRVIGNTTGSGGDGTVNGGGGGASGAGIYISGSATATLIDSDVSNNQTGDGGSGLTFPGRGGSGGGIYNAGTLTATNCTFSGNNTGKGGDGGAGDVDGASGGDGAGIHLDIGSISTFKNCTFHANITGGGGDPSGSGTAGAAGSGGAISASSANLLLQNTTVFNNRLGINPGAAGAGLSLSGPGGSAEIRNSIIAGNVTGAGQTNPDIFQTNHPLIRSGVNLIGDNSSVTTEFPAPAVDGEPNVNGDLVGTMALPFDPDLGLFQDNGGLTRTVLPNATSPAIDPVGGDTTTDTTTDQRGEPRISNLILDIGAIEVQIPVPPGPRISTRKRIRTKRNRAKLRVTVAANASANLQAKATGGAKAKVKRRASPYKVDVKKLRRRVTRVKLTARDAFGQIDREKVKIIMK